MNAGKLFTCLSRTVLSLSKPLTFSKVLARVFHDNENEKFVMKLPTGSAFVQYKNQDDVFILASIFVPRKYREIGIGQELAREVLEYCSDNNIKVILTCPYLVTFYNQHPFPQYKKIVIGIASSAKT